MKETDPPRVIGGHVPDDRIPTTLAYSPTLEGRRRSQRERTGGRFLPGLPAETCARCMAISATAVVLLQVIGMQVRLHKSVTVPLSPATTRLFGIPHRTARRTLRRLEKAGLITLEVKPGRSPTVTLIAGDYTAWLLHGQRQPRNKRT